MRKNPVYRDSNSRPNVSEGYEVASDIVVLKGFLNVEFDVSVIFDSPVVQSTILL